MTDRPVLFSIVTVVKDDLAGFQRTRDSLLVQSLRDFEWLVADGGSSDGTQHAVAELASACAWSRSGPDGGPFDAMNLAMDRATGRYLLFLNGGDRLAGPDALALAANGLAAAGWPAMAWADTAEDGTGGRVRPARSRRWAVYGMPAHHSAIFYRRDRIMGVRYRCGYRIAADYAFTVEALERVDSVAELPFTLSEFASGGLSQRHPRLGRQEQDAIRRDLLRTPRWLRMAVRSAQLCASTFRKLTPFAYERVWLRTAAPRLVNHE